ncbi:MAG: HlyD family efflux transporter periplasmic adaptor subunit [Candidatus Pacebacteria bacterium]|nr:HlyD family efflux transporter periplasmic adaptor subunit [Candidatus Paceibacterota bacterium]
MAIPAVLKNVGGFFKGLWKKFLSYSRVKQAIIVAVVLAVVIGGIVLTHGNSSSSDSNTLPTVAVASVDSFGGSTDGVSVLGTVQSVSEADLLAQSGGTVETVHTSLGASVPAGFVIAELDNAAAAAAVLQAQGAYDAALASEQATNLTAQNNTGTFAEAQTSVRNTYQSAYVTLDGVLSNDVDTLFGASTAVGPELLINPLSTGDTMSRGRQSITLMMGQWQASLATTNTTDPLTLLSNAQTNLTTVSTFLTSLANLANQSAADATPAQLSALAAARSSVSTLLANISTARDSYNAAATTAAVSQTQAAGASTSVTSSEASVEEALGGLRAAQASYEKTIIRAPIAGTINYLPIKVGDYVTLNQHVATVARNNALEVVMYLSQDDRNRVAVGDTLAIGAYKGVITTIAPALDPTTKQIEVDIAVNDGTDLVNGQSVQVTLPALAYSSITASGTASTTASEASSTTSTVLLPLTAVKLLPNERDVFSVDSTGHLVAHQVQIGDVIGDRIEVTTPLAGNLEIVTDARGLAAGDAVLIASSTPSTSS